MSDLILGYLLVINILFSANIGLFLGNFGWDNKKSSLVSILIGIIFFIVTFTSTLITIDVIGYLTYIFILASLLIFIILIYYLKVDKFKVALMFTIILYYIISFLLACQLDWSAFNGLLLSVVSIIVMIVAFQSSKLLMYAKRPYNVIIGEFMSLFGILIFLFGLTNMSIMQLDYVMFSSFLILTPTYQLIYVLIGIVIVLIIGLYLNDNKKN